MNLNHPQKFPVYEVTQQTLLYLLRVGEWTDIVIVSLMVFGWNLILSIRLLTNVCVLYCARLFITGFSLMHTSNLVTQVN